MLTAYGLFHAIIALCLLYGIQSATVADLFELAKHKTNILFRVSAFIVTDLSFFYAKVYLSFTFSLLLLKDTQCLRN